MFDTYETGSGNQNHYYRTEITEKRAPTDESIRLLREMEQKAQEQVINALRLDGNEFKFIIQHLWSEMEYSHKFIMIYDLNGKRIVVKAALPSMKQDKQKVADMLIDELAKSIASELLRDQLSEAFKSWKLP
jgi:hypothetical protein